MPKHKNHHKHSLIVDKLILIVAIVEPLFTVPQAYIIFANRSATDISLTTWIGYNVMTAIWIWYAIKHKEKVVLLYQSLFFILNTIIVIGALLYGGKWF